MGVEALHTHPRPSVSIFGHPYFSLVIYTHCPVELDNLWDYFYIKLKLSQMIFYDTKVTRKKCLMIPIRRDLFCRPFFFQMAHVQMVKNLYLQI